MSVMLRYLQLDYLDPMRYEFEFDKLGLSEVYCESAWKSKEDKTIFDFNFANQKNKKYLLNLAKCLFSLKCLSKFEKMKNYVEYFSGIMLANGIGLNLYCDRGDGNVYPVRASSLCLFGSFFNHSCDPNISRVPIENRIVFYACKPVKKGEQLFITYG